MPEQAGTTALPGRRPLAVLFVVTGLLLPLIPRWIVPKLFPYRHYLDDTAASLIREPRWLALFSAFAVVPFLALAVFSLFHLRGAEPALLRRRRLAIIVTFVALFALGWECHLPQTSPGVNMAVLFFPFYAAIAGPMAYGLGRAVASRLH